MSENSDASVSPIIHKGKRKAPILTDSNAESDSSSDIDVTERRRNGKRKNRIRESNSDSSIDKPRKIKRVPCVTSDSESSNSDESDIVKTKKPARVVSDDSNNSDSDASGASDNGFEDNSSDGWESDWISESEIINTEITEASASTSINLANMSDSSDGESEKCPICLLSFNTQEVGTPETCDHSFCADCIQEWSKNVNTCPVDRQTFTLILVRKRFDGKVIRSVPVDGRRPSVDELIQEDPTFCEICGMSDREDRLLLCDGCDLGYHLECLDPPMETVPIDEWFCSNCRQVDSVQQPQRGSRRLLPRTMQSERVRATITTNRNFAIMADQQSLSSGFEDVAAPGPSRSRNRSAAPAKKQKRKKKRARYTITYDICEVTGEKIAIKKKKKYKRTKRKKSRAKRRARIANKPKTVKKRLAFQLGMCPPKKVGQAVPEVKVKGAVSIGYQRSQAGIPTLHLFGQRDQLDYFSDSDTEAVVAGGEVGILQQIRVSSRAVRRKAAVLNPTPLSVSSIDILSSILDSQEKLHSKNSVISVNRDGTLHIQPSRSERNNNIEDILSNSPLDLSGEIETTQAPMFPGRGGGNRQPYFHNRGGYRDNRYENNSGGGYFQGGGPRNRGFGQFNQFNQRDNFGGGFTNYHHHGGPPPPYRGRGGPRFPRRPQQQQPPEIIQPEVIEPPEIELNLDEPPVEESTQPEQEEVDIYSDIEDNAALPPEDDPNQKPVGLVAYNNSGTDDDSGSELVIDDSVKETDKYDPTEPSADTDSNSEPPLVITEPKLPEKDKFSTEAVNEAVQQVIQEHLDNDEVMDDEDCPNFSIYSSTSINIAKSSEISVDVAKEEPKVKDPSWESGDEWDETDTNNQEVKTPEEPPNNDKIEEITESVQNVEIQEVIEEEDRTQEVIEEEDEIQEVEEEKVQEIIEKEEESTEIQETQPKIQEAQPEIQEILETEPEIQETQKTEPEISEAIVESPKKLDEKEGDESPKPDDLAVNIPLPETEEAPEALVAPSAPPEDPKPAVKIAFTLGKKYPPINTKKERILQLYDDSDWEEWESKNEVDKSKTEKKPASDLEKMTEAISEEERSYTPCLDEREPLKSRLSEERNVGIGGMDTELISDEERNDIFDESHDMKTSDGDALEINAKESELDMTRPEDYEEGEIIEKLGAKKVQELDKKSNSDDEKNKKRPKKKEPEKIEKPIKKPEFKKISKNTKDRNYRDKDKDKDKDKARSKSKERKEKEKKEEKKRKERKRDLERYNVRSIIAEKPKKDQFGRDIKSASSSKSRSRSPSWNRAKRRRRRSRSRSRSRTPRRSKSRSPRVKRYRLDRSNSRERSRDRNRRYGDRNRLRNKKKNRSLSRTRVRTRTPSPKHRIREWEEPRRQSYTREWTPSWSRSPTPPRPVTRHIPQSMSPSWTPPLLEKGPVQPENLTVILTNNEVNKTKKKEKKKKADKKNKDEYRKRKRADRTPPPSKEVFASGDNILVSVSFNKTNEENAVATREVTGMKRKRDETNKKKKDKKKRPKSPRTKKKNKEIANMKPVAIIDLDRSPFKEITPSPKDIIVLSDSDNCEKEAIMQETAIQEDSAPQSPTASYLNSTGPKTPPEPQIKFLLTSKQTQLRQINNPLHDPNEIEPDIDPQEELEHRLDDVLHKGPNTPPEPPSSPPSSPDAYDPFDPTKSRSATPEPTTITQPITVINTPPDKIESDGDLVDLAVGPLESSQKTVPETTEKRLSLSPERTLTPPVSSEPTEPPEPNTDKTKSPERNTIGVVINQQVVIPTPVITSTPSAVTLPRTNLTVKTSVPQRIILPTPAKSSPAKMSPLKTSPSKPPIKSTPIKPMPSKTMISKLPVPNMKPITPVRKQPQRNSGQNGNEIIDVDLDFESPYSPGSSDYEDLFEPPAETTKNNNRGKNTKSPAKGNVFDVLFGSSPVFRPQNKNKSKTNAAKIPVKMNKKSTPTKGGTKTVGVKIDEDNLKILDDLPNSAVEMQVKDKFLKKLNRQERVVEEVKLVLKPHYNKKHVTKEQYKDILRRAVPKICHNRSGEINPKKIQNLIEAYVKKARHNKKLSGGATANTGNAGQQPKPAKTTFWS